MSESGAEADIRRLTAFQDDGGRTVIPDALAGYVHDLIWRDIPALRRKSNGTRDDILDLLDRLTVASERYDALAASGQPIFDIGIIDGVGAAVVAKPVLLSVDQVAGRLRCSVRTVRRMLSSGQLPGSKDVGNWVILESDLENFISGEAA